MINRKDVVTRNREERRRLKRVNDVMITGSNVPYINNEKRKEKKMSEGNALLDKIVKRNNEERNKLNKKQGR